MAEPGALITFTERRQNNIPFTGFRRCCLPTPASAYNSRRENPVRPDVRPHGLSIRNGWLDEQERVFIYFTLEETMDAIVLWP